MTQCPHCSSSEHQTKSGHTATGSQRYKCKQCQRIYTPDPKPLGYPEETKREAVRLYLEGTNFRRIGRVLGVNHQSVVNWVNSYHVSLPAAERPVSEPETLEMDELITFVGSKKLKPTSSPSSKGRPGASSCIMCVTQAIRCATAERAPGNSAPSNSVKQGKKSSQKRPSDI